MVLNNNVSDGTFSLFVEIDPPKGSSLGNFLKSALSVRGRVDAIIVSDGEHAIMRMSPTVPSYKLIKQNIPTVMTINGRDRNRLSFQGDLLAADALDIKNIIIKEGQDPAIGDQPLVQTSGDLDLDIMLKCVFSLNNGTDLGAETLDGGCNFNIGVGIEISDDNSINKQKAKSLNMLKEFGVSYIILSPTYDFNIIETFSPFAEEAELDLFASIMPLKSVAMIRYLNNLPGVPAIPHVYLKRMMKAPIKAQAGLEIAADYYNDLKQCCQGVVLHSLGWGDRIPDFLDIIDR